MTRRGIAAPFTSVAIVAAALLATALVARPDGPDAPAASATASAAPGLQDRVAHIAAEVGAVRGLPVDHVPPTTLLGNGALASRVADEQAGYTAADADADRRILTLLGAVPADLDLRAALSAAYAGQVIGFYDPDTRDLVIGDLDRASGLSPLEQLTVAHELDHALVDAQLGLPDLTDLRPDETDRALATRSLVEGDATVTTRRYADRALSAADRVSLAQQLAGLEGRRLDTSGLPSLLRASLIFPYTAGADFVADLIENGGWDAVDRAYADPPTTTAQILFPQRYRDGEPAVRPRVPGQLAPPWIDRRRVSFGAAELMWLFAAPGGDPGRALPDPRGAAAAWAGGLAELWTDGPRSALGVALVRRGGDHLCRDVASWLRSSLPDAAPLTAASGDELALRRGDEVRVLRCSPREVRLGIAPTRDDATVLAGT